MEPEDCNLCCNENVAACAGRSGLYVSGVLGTVPLYDVCAKLATDDPDGEAAVVLSALVGVGIPCLC